MYIYIYIYMSSDVQVQGGVLGTFLGASAPNATDNCGWVLERRRLKAHGRRQARTKKRELSAGCPQHEPLGRNGPSLVHELVDLDAEILSAGVHQAQSRREAGSHAPESLDGAKEASAKRWPKYVYIYIYIYICIIV